MRLDGKVALVTGSSRGLGRAIAERIANEGAAVVVTGRRQSAQGEDVARGIVGDGGQAIFHAADVRDHAAIQELVALALRIYGRMDILVNSAGIDIDKPRRVGEFPDPMWEDIMLTNLTAPFWLTKAVLPTMLAQRSGSIVNIASIAGLKAWPGGCAYNAAKAGLIMLTKTVAVDYARDGIRCNVICPGVFATDLSWQYVDNQPDRDAAIEETNALHPMHRWGQPDEIAHAAMYFASDTSAFTTGAVLSVDGGMSAI